MVVCVSYDMNYMFTYIYVHCHTCIFLLSSFLVSILFVRIAMQCNSAMATWLANTDINGDEILSMIIFLKFFIYSTDKYLQVHSCSVHKWVETTCHAVWAQVFYLLFVLTKIYTYRFIYYHKWWMSPPPQWSRFTTEGSSCGPKWRVSTSTYFSFFFFILFTTLYRFMYQHKQQMLPPPQQWWCYDFKQFR